MAQVVDASVAIAWCAPSQSTPATAAVLRSVIDGGGYVPGHFWLEVIYNLDALEHRRIVNRAAIDIFLSDLAALSLSIDRAYQADAMIGLHRLARGSRLSIYDAAYLELALRLDLPLATRDVALARAATSAGVPLFHP